jgi:hypothetical protein
MRKRAKNHLPSRRGSLSIWRFESLVENMPAAASMVTRIIALLLIG